MAENDAVQEATNGLPHLDPEDDFERLVGQAAKVVARAGYANKTLIQQTFRIRSEVAVEVLRRLEEAEVVSPPQTPKPRDVLVDVVTVDLSYLDDLFPLPEEPAAQAQSGS